MAHGQGGRGRTPGAHVHVHVHWSAWERGFCLRVCGRLGTPPVVYRACGVWAPRRGWHELWLACAAACGRERCVLCVVRWGLPSHRRVFLYSILSEQVSAVSRALDNCPPFHPTRKFWRPVGVVAMLARSLRALSRGARLRFATLPPCIRTERPTLCAIRMCASVAEPEGMQRLADTIGDRNAKRLMQTHGVTSRLADGSLLTGIQRLREEFGISGDGLITFWGNGSVAARLEDKAFWAGLARLSKLGISGDGLITFMSDGVAARLGDEAFWARLSLLGDFGISGDRLVTFMSGSVAARLEDEAFWDGLTRLNQEFGISGKGLVTFMSGSVAARLEDKAFWAGLTRLDKNGISGDKLVTFMSGSVAARLKDRAFWVGLARLGKHGISGDVLVKFMSDSVAVRLEDEAFWAGLRRLSEQGIWGDGLVKFMSDGVAKRLEDKAFWAGLARLDKFGISGYELVVFMSGSVAARLDNDDFMDGLSSLCSELSPLATVELLKNDNPLASRLTPAYARSILSITRHLDSHGFDGAKRLKTLLGKSPLVGKVPELEVILLAADRPDKIEAELRMFRGSHAQKRAMAASL